MNYEIIGYMAGICMAICQFPQARMIWKTNNTEGISIVMFSILTLGTSLWCLYGIINGFASMWLTNGVCLVPCFYILFVSIRNKIRKKQEQK